MDADPSAMLAKTRNAYVGRSSWADLTLPLVSMRTGAGTLSRLQEIFGDLRIEDLPIPFFCVSCNLTRAEAVIHDSGPVALWTRVSCSVPGLLPPVPWDGDLLVDGGLLNNLPVEAMQKRLGGSVIASNVSVAVDLAVDADLSSRSSWSATTQLLRKFSHRSRLPTIVNLLMRTAEVSSVRDSRVSGSPSALNLELPVSQYSMTDFDAIDRLVELGYQYTTTRLRELKSLSSTKQLTICS
jgi:predicted acylesterase/phospholipase RssA